MRWWATAMRKRGKLRPRREKMFRKQLDDGGGEFIEQETGIASRANEDTAMIQTWPRG